MNKIKAMKKFKDDHGLVNLLSVQGIWPAIRDQAQDYMTLFLHM